MNPAISIFVWILLYHVEVSQPLLRRPVCAENEYLETGCAVPECEPTCMFPSKDMCNAKCSFNKCMCKEGFYRNSQGICTKDCSSEPCGYPNAVRKECGKMLTCQKTCLQRKLPRFCETLPCVPMGCECKPGFVLDYGWNGQPSCIRPYQCRRMW